MLSDRNILGAMEFERDTRMAYQVPAEVLQKYANSSLAYVNSPSAKPPAGTTNICDWVMGHEKVASKGTLGVCCASASYQKSSVCANFFKTKIMSTDGLVSQPTADNYCKNASSNDMANCYETFMAMYPIAADYGSEATVAELMNATNYGSTYAN